ncbi:MAG: hypothetical protein QUU85_09665, partial [Candidatus Eisenbacteria bacterium]|nr:hypothetical protein [Candidatus Eisenbacteria bacterium]
MARMVRMAGMTRFHRFPTFRFGLWLVLAVSLPGLGVAFGASSEGPAGAAPTVPDSRAGGSRLVLPDPVIHPHSAEICSNSRISYHGGWSAGATESMLANVLFAAGRAPVTGGSRTIYVATASNVSIYDPASHSLILHKSGDWREDSSASFEVGIAAEQIVDAGAAMHLAQLESVTTWTGTANQLASCPRASATTYANGHWSPVEPIDIVISFGMRSVPGLTTTLVATSSDGSLPDPHTDGTVYMDDVLHDLAYGSSFADEDLSLDQVSQILWAAYGCSDHRAAGSKAGLTVSSAVANYYLTRRIYWVGPDGVFRYHNRLPPGTDATTRDHRIEQVQSGDARPALRGQVPGLPEAPGYLIACSGTATDWAVLECGFAAVGGVLQASSIGLQGWLRAGLTGQEQAGIRSATGVPSADLP